MMLAHNKVCHSNVCMEGVRPNHLVRWRIGVLLRFVPDAVERPMVPMPRMNLTRNALALHIQWVRLHRKFRICVGALASAQLANRQSFSG